MANFSFSSKIFRNPDSLRNLTSTFFKAQLGNKKFNNRGHSCGNSNLKFLQQSEILNPLNEVVRGRAGSSFGPVFLSRFPIEA